MIQVLVHIYHIYTCMSSWIYCFTRFRDHKGNWVTVTRQSSSVLESLIKTVVPSHVKIQDSYVFVDIKSMVCSCTDHLWRSSLRDSCQHIKAAKLFQEANREGAREEIITREIAKLVQDLRRQQLAKPKEGRNVLLCSSEQEVWKKRFITLPKYLMVALYETVKTIVAIFKHFFFACNFCPIRPFPEAEASTIVNFSD